MLFKTDEYELFIKLYGWFILRFRASCWWWDLKEMLHKAALVLARVFATSTVATGIYMIAVSVVALLMQLWFEPFEKKHANRQAAFLLMTQLVTLGLGTTSDGTTGPLALIVVALNVVAVFPMIEQFANLLSLPFWLSMMRTAASHCFKLGFYKTRLYAKSHPKYKIPRTCIMYVITINSDMVSLAEITSK